MENLIRTSDLLVFDAQTRGGKKSFNITDIILSHNGLMTGIIISGKGLFGLKHYVPAKSVHKIQKEKVIIKGYGKFNPKRIKDLKYASKNLMKKKVISEDNSFLGMLSDFYIHSEKMQVMAVEVASSFFEDLFTGRILIPGNIIADESNAIRITEIQLENKLHNTKGIMNAIDDGLNRQQ